ncbi:hypothetical protein [uncultured Methanolobus sp.]|uniref:hypothetical protein n=1 Tax=uncultured Methanolobus sp. TaxID=218300 RepID=UPI002AAAE8DC|nr:hypothetical protein [uncultured Methanolobus sp.]
MAKKNLDILRTLAESQSMTARQIFEITRHHSYNGLRNSLSRLNKDGKVEINRDAQPHQWSITGAGRDYLRLKISPMLPFFMKVLPYLMDEPMTEDSLFQTLEGYYSQVYFTECMKSMRKKGYVVAENDVLSVTKKAYNELGLYVMKGVRP